MIDYDTMDREELVSFRNAMAQLEKSAGWKALQEILQAQLGTITSELSEPSKDIGDVLMGEFNRGRLRQCMLIYNMPSSELANLDAQMSRAGTEDEDDG